MNSQFLRTLLITTLAVVYLLGAVMPGAAQVPQAPACGMACCEKNVCECLVTPSEESSQPAPADPVASKLELKYTPQLLACLSVPAVSGKLLAAPLPAEMKHAGKAQATPIFRLHCALLM